MFEPCLNSSHHIHTFHVISPFLDLIQTMLQVHYALMSKMLASMHVPKQNRTNLQPARMFSKPTQKKKPKVYISSALPEKQQQTKFPKTDFLIILTYN